LDSQGTFSNTAQYALGIFGQELTPTLGFTNSDVDAVKNN
jgi:hypothetical protein